MAGLSFVEDLRDRSLEFDGIGTVFDVMLSQSSAPTIRIGATRRVLPMEALIWEARQIAQSLATLIIPQSGRDAAITLLNQIEQDATALSQAGTEGVTLPIPPGRPLHIQTVADTLAGLKEQLALDGAAAPRR